MRKLSLMVLVFGWAVTAAPAADDSAAKPASDESFAALRSAYMDAMTKFREEQQKEMKAQKEANAAKVKAAEEALKEAKTDEEKAAAQRKLKEARVAPAGGKIVVRNDGPNATFAPRFLQFAEKNPNDPSAFESIVLAMRTSGGPNGKNPVWGDVLKLLQAKYVTAPEIKRVLPHLAMQNDPTANNLIREVMARHPDHKTQARACKVLANALTEAVANAERFAKDSNLRKLIDQREGTDYVDRLIANADKNKKEGEELTKILRDKYGDVYADLSIGKPAPEVVNKDIDGNSVKLSDLKGKVVVLDIWATWCGPCRAMIPHEREMVSRLKDKPFALISVSADEKKETLTAFIEKEKMPWTHWWNGHEGGIIEDWDVQYFPTIYVLDANGVIRHKDLRDAKLEEAVNELLKEMDEKKER